MIASTLTFIGSVTPVIFQGASLVFVDCDRQTWNMDPDLLAQELAACKRRGCLPKAVIPTDQYGNVRIMSGLWRFVKQRMLLSP